MPETPANNNLFEETLRSVNQFKTATKSFAESIAELHRANSEIKNSRRAALNALEDSILSKVALAKSEERLQLALKAAKMGTFIYYVQHDRTEPDEQMLALFGLLPGDELNLAKALNELIHPDDCQRYASEVAAAINPLGKGRLNSDIRVVHPDGSVHWLNVTAQVNFEGEPWQAVTMPGVCIDITERKIAEEALRDSEEAFRSYVTASSDIVYKMSADWQTMINLQGKNFLTSVTNPTVSWIDIYIPEHERKKLQQAIDKAIATKTLFELEHQVLNAEGNLSWVFSRAVPRINEQGKVVEWLGAASDITERKKAEESLRTSEAQLRALIKSLPGCAVFVVNKDLQYILAEGEALLEAGFVPEDIAGKTVSEVIPEDLRAHYISRYQNALKGIPFNEEHEAHNRTFISRGVPLTNANGKVYAVLAVSYDITDRKNAEEALHVSEERYRIALESANMGAWDWNIKEDKIVWNDQHYYVLGVQPHNAEKNADYFLQFIHPDDQERVTDSLMKAVDVAGTYQADFRIVRADNNEVRWMVGYGSTINQENGRAIRMVGVMFDITERKKLEQQKEDFIGIASHELKTPVTSIKAYAEVLHDIFDESKDAASAALMKKLDAQVDRLIDLIRALLDTSKLAEGELTLNPSTFDMCNLIEERIQDLQRLSSSHHLITIKPKEIFITADRERIGQVLTNLISNAIKYSPQGGDVTIEWKKVKSEVQVSVSDSGIGISKEAQQKVFDRFFRVKSEQMKNYAGMGLGLYITAYIIQKHGGRIWVESKPGEGATFYFTLAVGNRN